MIILRRASSSLLASGSRLRFLRSAPFSTAAQVEYDGRSSSAAQQHPKLKNIPSLPFFGTQIPAYSGVPAMNFNDHINWCRRQHKDHGPFYTYAVPGFGSGLHGTIHVVRDPHEMLKVIKQEGSYPSGIVEKQWPVRTWMKKRNYSAKALFDHGEEWKRMRSFMQKDLLSPASAREYLPGILKGAAKASKKAPQFDKDKKLLKFLNFCAADMFTQVLFGGDDNMTEEDYSNFCNAAIDGLSGSIELMFSPFENVARMVGIETPGTSRLIANFDLMDEIAQRRFKGFLERAERKELTDREENSYFFKMMQRQPESDLTVQEAMDLSLITMIASVDTTAAKIAWGVLQLALHQDIQRKLYEQLDQAVQKEGGVLTPAVFERSEVPLLAAFIRETHRCTPPVPVDISKVVNVPTTVHGITLPAGSTIVFDTLTNQLDPNLVEDPMVFQPERWFKENVAARKNTPAAIIDHPFYSGPFSQGARRCPGSRVAHLEEQALIAQLLLDWHIEGPNQTPHWRDIPGKLQTFYVPDFPDEVRLVPRS